MQKSSRGNDNLIEDAKREVEVRELVRLTESDVKRIASEQKLSFKSEESLLKYLRREGFKIRSTRQKQQSPSNSSIERYENKIVNNKKQEFKKYLFGDTSIQQVKREIAFLKKSLRIN